MNARQRDVARYLLHDAVFDACLAARDKSSAITAMVCKTVAALGLGHDAQQSAIAAVLDREATRTTAIGNGLAFPHALTNAVPDLMIGWFRLEQPMHFQALDGRPVTIAVCMVLPLGYNHIFALTQLSRLFTALRPAERRQLETAADTASFKGMIMSAYGRACPQ